MGSSAGVYWYEGNDSGQDGFDAWDAVKHFIALYHVVIHILLLYFYALRNKLLASDFFYGMNK